MVKVNLNRSELRLSSVFFSIMLKRFLQKISFKLQKAASLSGGISMLSDELS